MDPTSLPIREHSTGVLGLNSMQLLVLDYMLFTTIFDSMSFTTVLDCVLFTNVLDCMLFTTFLIWYVVLCFTLNKMVYLQFCRIRDHKWCIGWGLLNLKIYFNTYNIDTFNDTTQNDTICNNTTCIEMTFIQNPVKCWKLSILKRLDL